MSVSNFKLNHAGAAEVLKKMAAGEIAALAKQVADNAGGEDDVAWMHTYTTDRAAAAVTVPAGRQAKHGALTRAAAAAGLEVHSNSDRAQVQTPSIPSSHSTSGGTRRRWTADELGLLYGQGLTNAEIASRTGRSVSAVAAQRGKRLR